ncbi:MAG: hypothetical protein HZC54_16610 [Verrucomicrobia bacterium]|nr:hypothetical protein [Verrucomicrobiota bacterium]
MRALAERIAKGDPAAFDQLCATAEELFRDMDYGREQQRLINNNILMRAAFDVLGESSGKGNATAFDALKKATGVRRINGYAAGALGTAAATGHAEALEMLLGFNRWGILKATAVSALEKPAAKNQERAVNFLIRVLADPADQPFWMMARRGLTAAANSGNANAKAALEEIASGKPVTVPPDSAAANQSRAVAAPAAVNTAGAKSQLATASPSTPPSSPAAVLQPSKPNPPRQVLPAQLHLEVKASTKKREVAASGNLAGYVQSRSLNIVVRNAAPYVMSGVTVRWGVVKTQLRGGPRATAYGAEQLLDFQPLETKTITTPFVEAAGRRWINTILEGEKLDGHGAQLLVAGKVVAEEFSPPSVKPAFENLKPLPVDR